MYYNNYSYSVILFIVCVIFSQFCSYESNVIINDKNLYERQQTVGQTVGQNVGESVSIDSNINTNDNNNNNDFNADKRLDIKKVKPMQAQLYGYAQLIDPRQLEGQKSQKKFMSFVNHNKQPIIQSNSHYQQLFNNFKLNDGLHPVPIQQSIPNQINANTDEETVKLIKNYLRKNYDLKKYFLKKILGDSYDAEEGHDEGFFNNKHLRRHGAAGWAGKVFGELIGIKVRKSIEGFGDTVSDYAKELTANTFVSMGNTFNKYFRNTYKKT